MTVRTLTVVGIILAAGLALVAKGSSLAPAFAAAMVVLMAWALVGLLEWRSALRLRLAARPAVGPTRRRRPKA